MGHVWSVADQIRQKQSLQAIARIWMVLAKANKSTKYDQFQHTLLNNEITEKLRIYI